MGTTTTQENSAIYTFIYVGKQYLQLINWRKIVTYILALTIFFLKTAHLIINWLVLSGMRHVVLKDHPQHLTKYESKGTKISICKLLQVQSTLFKNPNFPSILCIGKNSQVYTAQDQQFKINIFNLWMN